MPKLALTPNQPARLLASARQAALNTSTPQHFNTHKTFMTARTTPTGMNKKFKKVLPSQYADYYWERFNLDSVHETALKQESTNTCSQPACYRAEHEDENSILFPSVFTDSYLCLRSWVGERVSLSRKNLSF